MSHSIDATHGPVVLLTRPAAASARFAQMLAGFETVISPVLQTRFLEPAIDLTGCDAVVFTSANGVEALAKLTVARDLVAFCVGERTAELARSHGFDAVSAQGTVADLTGLLAERHAGDQVFYARGQDVAHDLGTLLRSHNIRVVDAVVYSQESKGLSSAATKLLKSQAKVLVPLFSPRTATIFASHLQSEMTAPRIGLCLSDQVRANCPDDQFATLAVCAHPDAKSMLHLIQSYQAS